MKLTLKPRKKLATYSDASFYYIKRITQIWLGRFSLR